MMHSIIDWIYDSTQIALLRGRNVSEINIGVKSGAWAAYNPSSAKKSACPSGDQLGVVAPPTFSPTAQA